MGIPYNEASSLDNYVCPPSFGGSMDKLTIFISFCKHKRRDHECRENLSDDEMSRSKSWRREQTAPPREDENLVLEIESKVGTP